MSYNIDTWKIKKMNNLRIPVKAFFPPERTYRHPDKEYDENGILTLTMRESHVTGKVSGGVLMVSDINIEGEGSGNAMREIIEPALKQSTGELVAACVWEGGDRINQLTVKNGTVTWEDIEI